jgi:cellobiose phosphorylase
VCLMVRNDSDRPRRLSATYYVEWVLGTDRENAPLQVVCERHQETGAIVAQNAWAGDFAKKIAFAACGSPAQYVTADRREFLGKLGSVSTPAALRPGLFEHLAANARRSKAHRTGRSRRPWP